MKIPSNYLPVMPYDITQEYGYTAGFEDPFENQWWIVAGEKE